MKNITVESVIVVLDSTEATARMVAELSGAGALVTAVGSNFRDVVSVLSGDVYALVADVSDPEQWSMAVRRAEHRNGIVGRVIDPAGRLAAVTAA